MSDVVTEHNPTRLDAPSAGAEPDATVEQSGPDTAVTSTPRARSGRKQDRSRDAAILDAALLVLAEHGWEGMTMDMVAAEAKAGKATVYRRWTSKAHLVADAVARMAERELDLDQLPDTGTLRGDLTALIRPDSIEHGQRRLKIMTAVVAMQASNVDTALSDAATAASAQPWVTANRILIDRAVARGEIAVPPDVALLSSVIPALSYYRVTVEGLALNGEHMLTLIDTVLLPALGLRHGTEAVRTQDS